MLLCEICTGGQAHGNGIQLRRNTHKALRQGVVNLPCQARSFLKHQRKTAAYLP